MNAAPTMPAPAPRRYRRALIAGILLALAVALFLAGYLPRRLARRQLVAESQTAAAALPRVRVVDAVARDSGRTLALPGDVVASQRTIIYARATGFIRRFDVDIGRHVTAGDVLAEIDTPELTDQVVNARAMLAQKDAALAQSIAQQDFAHVTMQREDALLAEALVSKQENDQAHAAAQVSDANVNAARSDVAAARATVKQLGELLSFAKVVAPFSGTITQRLIEVGSLVSTGSSTPTPLFQLEATDPMRVFVRVPQAFAPSIHVDHAAKVAIRQFPGRTFDGRVTRTAGALDPVSRTLDTEVDVANANGQLLAGMYGEVTLDVALAHPVVRVPSSALLTDARGMHVATVDDAGIVHLVAVRPGPDDGNVVDLVDGLRGGEHVIVSPGGDTTEGMHVATVSGGSDGGS